MRMLRVRRLMKPTIGSLFSGYGGLDIAVKNHYGATVAWHSEIDASANRVLAAHDPDIPNLGDMTKIDWNDTPPVEILTGGYPCQPFSHAGHRKGDKDERHLWPYVCAAIDALRPRLAILENVRGHLTLGFGDVLSDLSRIGYDARWAVVRASDAGAPHGRARLFIAAYPSVGRLSQRDSGSGKKSEDQPLQRPAEINSAVPYPSSTGLQGPSFLPESAGRQEPRGTSGSDRTAIPPHPDSDGHGFQLHPRGMGGLEGRAAGEAPERQRSRSIAEPGIDWGKYEQAIRRWEAVTREAPSPTVERDGRPRLSPVFVEWMMGLDEGHVTGHGLTSANELKMLGNGVCPQQAEMAIGILERMT